MLSLKGESHKPFNLYKVTFAMSLPLDQQETYYVFINGEQKGPYTREELLALGQSGTVNSDTLGWKVGESDWAPLKAFVTGFLPPPPPVPSTTPPPPPPSSKPFPVPESPPVTPPNHQPLGGYESLPSSPPRPTYRSEVLGFTVLGLDGLLSVFLCFSMWYGTPLVLNVLKGEEPSIVLSLLGWLEWLLIILLSVFIFLDAKRLGMGGRQDRTPKGHRRTGPLGWAIFCGLMPVYLYRRRLYGARNLLLPGLCLLAVSLVSFVLSATHLLREVKNIAEDYRYAPPPVNSEEVIMVIEDIAHRNFEERCLGVLSPVEVRYDKEKQRRIGRASLKMASGETYPFVYSVQWKTPEMKNFEVQIADHESEL